MALPIAYHCTLRCYGTWLPGDERGWHRRGRDGRQAGNAHRRRRSRRLMKHPRAKLTRPLRRLIESVVEETCRRLGWTLWALNVRTEHLHAAVSSTLSATDTAGLLKRHIIRALRRAGAWPDERPLFSRGGIPRSIWSRRGLDAVCDYIINRQGPPI